LPAVLLERARFQIHDQILAINTGFAKLANRYPPSAETQQKFASVLARYAPSTPEHVLSPAAPGPSDGNGIEIDEDVIMHSLPPPLVAQVPVMRKSKRLTAATSRQPKKSTHTAKVPVLQPRHKPLETTAHPKPGARFVVNHYPELLKRLRIRRAKRSWGDGWGAAASGELDIRLLTLAGKNIRDSGRSWKPLDGKVVLGRNLKRVKRGLERKWGLTCE
jgi:hypothetical protein